MRTIPNKLYIKMMQRKKNDSDIKFKIPNEFSAIFFSAFPNYKVEKYDTYFVTKLPFRY